MTSHNFRLLKIVLTNWISLFFNPVNCSAIKTGRYTHEKKTRDIQEVKRLQQMQLLQLQDQNEGHHFQHHIKADPAASDTDTVMGCCGSQIADDVDSGILDGASSSPASGACEVTRRVADQSGSAMDHLIEKITRLHEQQTPHTREFFDRLPAKESEYVVSSLE